MTTEIRIQNGKTVYIPIVEEGIQLEWERRGVAGKLTFAVIKDEALNATEGNSVALYVDGKPIFYGFIFSRKYDKGETIKVTAYDQLRYLKNKDTYIYEDKKASELVTMIAGDFNLKLGSVEDTGFVIESRVEDNKTLFDIILNALDLTLTAKKKLYVLYDNFGQLTLKDIESMKLNVIIDEETGEDFDYNISIDGETYNKIKLSYENEETGKRDIYITQDGNNINEWGVLQYFETIDEKVNGKAKADALLSLYNRKNRTLTIKDAFGDIRVRGGTSVLIKLNLGDIAVANYMIVEKVTHSFEQNHHSMNLSLRGGIIS